MNTTLHDLMDPQNVEDCAHGLRRAQEHGGGGLEKWAREWGDPIVETLRALVQSRDEDRLEVERDLEAAQQRLSAIEAASDEALGLIKDALTKGQHLLDKITELAACEV